MNGIERKQAASEVIYLMKENSEVKRLAAEVAGDNCPEAVFQSADKLLDIKRMGERTAAEIIFAVWLAAARRDEVDEVFKCGGN